MKTNMRLLGTQTVILKLGTNKFSGGVVYNPADICKLEFDLLIISVAQYAKEIKKNLAEKYGVPADKIVVYQPMDKNICWNDERIIMLRACVNMLKERKISGNMAELGVYTGEFAKLLNRYFPDRKLYLFDTFQGFDAVRDKVEDGDLDNFTDTSVDLVLSKMTAPQNCIVKKGYFPDTAVDVATNESFCLVSLDADLYNPIKAGLEYFYPRLVKGGYIFIHDFGSYHYTDVKKAVYEYCNEHDIAMVPLLDRGLSVIISK